MLEKRKIIKDLSALPTELMVQVRRSYPNGFEQNSTSYTDKSGKKFWLFPLETEEDFYMIRIPVAELPESSADALENEYADQSQDQEDDGYGDAYQDDYYANENDD